MEGRGGGRGGRRGMEGGTCSKVLGGIDAPDVIDTCTMEEARSLNFCRSLNSWLLPLCKCLCHLPYVMLSVCFFSAGHTHC